MKKATKLTWYAANVVLPLSETARILQAIQHSAGRLAERARRLKQAKDKSLAEQLSFDEAVRASGKSREALIQRYLFAKRIGLLLFTVAAFVTVLLPLALFLAGPPFSEVLFGRVLSLSFMLAGFSGWMFANTLKNQYHLWQLQTRQLGTFAQWKATGHWLQDIFSWRIR